MRHQPHFQQPGACLLLQLRPIRMQLPGKRRLDDRKRERGRDRGRGHRRCGAVCGAVWESWHGQPLSAASGHTPLPPCRACAVAYPRTSHSALQLTVLGTDLLHSPPQHAENPPLRDWLRISRCVVDVRKRSNVRRTHERRPTGRIPAGRRGGAGGLSRWRPRDNGARSRPSAAGRPCVHAWTDGRCRGSRTGGRSRAANTERSNRCRAP